MAIPKVCGIETEYGILVRGPVHDNASNPVTASSLLINAYLAANHRKVGWDFEDEHPGVDARGFSVDDLLAPDVDTHLVNAVLTNGARYYVDHAHPEISTPECRTAFEALVFDRAAEEIVWASMQAATAMLPAGAEVLCHKNNSDGKGNSYGCHENYLVAREVPFGRIVQQVTPHFVTRQIVVGAGKVGCETPGISVTDVPYQISQRADFFEEEVGLETTLKRPIVNTRDEPHCDPSKYRRLHVIVGDANMSETATLVKLGATAIVLAMIEDDVMGDELVLANPVAAIRHVSHDPSLQRTVLLRSGQRATALEIQWRVLELALKYEQSHGLEPVGHDVGRQVLSLWESILAGLEHDPETVAHQVDWVAKRRIVRAYAQRHQARPDDARLKALDLQYHDLRPDKCLARRVGLDVLTTSAAVHDAMTNPPLTTRAYFRGRCLAKWPGQIVAANWDSLVFDVGRDPLRRVPMMEPLRGTADSVARLIDESDTPAELLARLGA
ncbi:MAG: proteasome accessory factor PafA2 [Actinobacteria bacterium]|jgi:proteasome accessory factor A|nr:proteasome accessory factor PafA2 [Ilumatobacteraceae bacterium]NMD26332.1 proteasome accessory factor PafA2 [Actinomycetota bacterium]MBP7889918.1 proteasome accessory factor PafA2 [Ilumatobacteraceae bacterium]MBP8211085.1 proteasome accessory factor PafA2 [Ilumatobacteraceae bacterium]HQY14130.1 depupylase/deamidase Dop [Ilumatobacteraceae bacterium]